MTPKDLALIYRMRRLGMRMPVRTLQAARATGLSIPLACSVLMQETGGGINEFGHDPTVAIGWGTVTKAKYEAYKRLRDNPTHGAHCQGVNVTQLTAVEFQDEADRLGGCWKPLVAMRVGFGDLAKNIRRDGLRAAVVAYNGSGVLAEHYADVVLARADGYAVRLGLPKPRKKSSLVRGT